MELESIRELKMDNWFASQEFAHLMDVCTLADAGLEAPRRLLSSKVATRCVAIARQLDIGDEDTVRLELAARVHRVGELLLHESLRRKSFLDMSSIEMKAYRQYPIFSAFKLNDDAGIICDIVLKHREYYSGDGFHCNDPGSDSKVPFAARILCVATEYEELMMFRGTDPQTQNTIQRRMLKNAIGRYDVRVIEALMHTIVAEHVIH